MKYCDSCGEANSDSAMSCSSCGANLSVGQGVGQNYSYSNYTAADDRLYGKASAGWWWIGFLNFIAGFILGGVLQNKMPDAAHKAKIGAIFGVIFVVVVSVIEYITMN